MKIKRKELNPLIQGIEAYDAQKLQHFKLTLLLTKNKKVINEEVELFEEAKKKILPMDDLEKYQKAQQELGRKYWKKDDAGEYVMKEANGQSVHELTNKAELDGKLQTLHEKYKKVIEKYEKGIKKAGELLDEEIDMDLKKITNADHVKQLGPRALSLLAPLIGCKISESLLEEKGDALKTDDVERILEWCEVEENEAVKE